MIGIVILAFEALMIILYGIFMRTDSTSTQLTSIDSGLYFIFGMFAFILKHIQLFLLGIKV